MASINLAIESTNLIAVTPDEKATVTDFYYLFQFYHVQLNKSYLIQLTPTNPNSNRYKKFSLDLANGISAPNGLDIPPGDGQYYIWQNIVDGNLDPDGLIELETGKFKVTAPESTEIKLNADGTQDYSLRAS